MDLGDAEDLATVDRHLRRTSDGAVADWPQHVQAAFTRIVERSSARIEIGPWLCPCGAGHARQYRQNPVFFTEWLRLTNRTWRDLVEPVGIGSARLREICGPGNDWAAKCEAERIAAALDLSAPAALFPSMSPQFADFHPPPDDLPPPESWTAGAN
jgi:hypothetical protein